MIFKKSTTPKTYQVSKETAADLQQVGKSHFVKTEPISNGTRLTVYLLTGLGTLEKAFVVNFTMPPIEVKLNPPIVNFAHPSIEEEVIQVERGKDGTIKTLAKSLTFKR